MRHPEFQRMRVTLAIGVVGLCATAYILGAWQGTSSAIKAAPRPVYAKTQCDDAPSHASSNASDTTSVAAVPSSVARLDFQAHHRVAFNESSLAKEMIPPCQLKYSEYTPCHDPRRARKFPKAMMQYRERHCPTKEKLFRCLIPAPPNYKNPFTWPQSRDYAWYDNIPHRELSIEKAVQNWIQVEGDRFRFPGGGTMFPHGADAYIDDIDALIPLTDGNIRTALDTGCGVASWGAFLLKRGIITMSFAPRDSHEAQVQFALERGVPAMIGVIGTERIPYPARAFDMAHCSRCLIPWNKFDGLYLVEVDRVLRARSEVLRLHASPEAGEELAERRSFEKPAPGIRSARSAKNRSSIAQLLENEKRELLDITWNALPKCLGEAFSSLATGRGEPFFSLQGAAKRFLLPNDRWLPREASSRCSVEKLAPLGSWRASERALRPGGYWILSGPPIRWKKHYKGWQRTEEDLKQEQDEIEDIAKRLCWKKVVERDDLSVWQKPINHMECANNRKADETPQFCNSSDVDSAWYKKMETCISPLPEVQTEEEVAGGALENWPQRALAVPPRITKGLVSGLTPEKFEEDNKLWAERAEHYKKLIPPLAKGRYRNVMDMNAGMGGFAAALMEYPLWVMNVVPAGSAPDALGVIYERGFIGTYHDWCEAFSTYPRTYDLIHADKVFSFYQDRCDITYILLEMDRILWPEGTVIFRDTVEMLVKIQAIIDGMRWKSQIMDHESGPFNPEKILVAVKTYWTGEPAQKQQ